MSGGPHAEVVAGAEERISGLCDHGVLSARHLIVRKFRFCVFRGEKSVWWIIRAPSVVSPGFLVWLGVLRDRGVRLSFPLCALGDPSYFNGVSGLIPPAVPCLPWA